MYPVNFNFLIAKIRSFYMCVSVLTKMEKLCLTVLVPLFVPCDAPGRSNQNKHCHTIPHEPPKDCDTITMKTDYKEVCYKKQGQKWTATIECINGMKYSYTCSHKDSSNWTPSPEPPCVSQVTTVVTSSTTSTETTSPTTASDDDDNGSVVAAAVTVPIVILIAIAVVIALFLWRRRRQKSTPTMESHPGTPITNKNYEHQGEHGLDKRISFLNIRTNDSVDSEYTEITLENSQLEDTTGSVYQTIDILPEDQIESSSGYGHLKMQKTNFIDKNYSHVSADQTNGKTSTDLTYAHTDSATDGQDSGDNDETMYNRLQTNPKANNGKHLPEKQEEGNDDADTEYNHATAGLPELSSENNIDTYSHLSSSLQNTHAQNSSNLMTRNIENERKEMQPYETFKESDIRPYDSGKVLNGDKGQQKVDSDGYETAVGTVHGYFILEPENGPSDNEVSFHVVEDNTEGKANDSICAEPYHQYFTLEKTDT